MLICPCCGTKFPKGTGHASRKRFCSPKCRAWYHNHLPERQSYKSEHHKGRINRGDKRAKTIHKSAPQPSGAGMILPGPVRPASEAERIEAIIKLNQYRQAGWLGAAARLILKYKFKALQQDFEKRHGIPCSYYVSFRRYWFSYWPGQCAKWRRRPTNKPSAFWRKSGGHERFAAGSRN